VFWQVFTLSGWLESTQVGLSWSLFVGCKDGGCWSVLGLLE
jgi:hypothetical protein